MGRLKKVAIIVAALVVFLGIGMALNAIGYDRGHSQGYELGKVEGYDEGHSKGYDKGQLEGYEEGHSKGYEEGHSKGYDKGQLEGYEEGHGEGYTAGRAKAIGEGQVLINPSYQEMKEFLKADKTDAKQYIKGKYDNLNMTADINKNAEAQGIRTAKVYIEFPKHSCTLVAFETTDMGLIFIEPQSDKEMKVEVGIKYYEDNGYRKQDWDDTIKEVVIAW